MVPFFFCRKPWPNGGTGEAQLTFKGRFRVRVLRIDISINGQRLGVLLERDVKSFQKSNRAFLTPFHRQRQNWVRGEIYGNGKVEPKIKSQELLNVLTVFVLWPIMMYVLSSGRPYAILGSIQCKSNEISNWVDVIWMIVDVFSL